MKSEQHPSDLVYIDEYDLKGSNFYWHKYENHGLSKDDVISAGVTDDRVQVAKELIEPLQAVNRELQERGWELYVKEGYRSKKLYEIVYQRRTEKWGKKETDSLLNMNDMPHASGYAVDVAIWDSATNKEVYLRRGDDGAPALFVDFYKGKDDTDSKNYQKLQEYLISVMFRQGFRLASKREYFHFNYEPGTPENY